MKPEELLKPRYKVIADYPHSGLTVGEIISGIHAETLQDHYNEYPHLFKRLEWFEERTLEEMPQYVRFGEFDRAHTIYRLEKPLEEDTNFWVMTTVNGEHCYPLTGSYPATEAEYLTFKNQQK